MRERQERVDAGETTSNRAELVRLFSGMSSSQNLEEYSLVGTAPSHRS